MSESVHLRNHSARKIAILFALAAVSVLVGIPALHAQDPEPAATRFTVKTGSYGLYPKVIAHTSLTETNAEAPRSQVRVSYLDEAGRVIKSETGALAYGQPFKLPVSYWRAGGRRGQRVVVRVVAEILTVGDGSGNSIILTMERHNWATGSLTTGPECPVGAEDPAGPGGPILPTCGCDVDREPADDVFPQ